MRFEEGFDNFVVVQMSGLELLLRLGVLALGGRRRRYCWKSGRWYCKGYWDTMSTFRRLGLGIVLRRLYRRVGQEVSSRSGGWVRSASPRWIFPSRGLRRTCEKRRNDFSCS